MTAPDSYISLRVWLAATASEQDIEYHRDPVVGKYRTVIYYNHSRIKARYRYADAMIAAMQEDPS